MSVFDRWGEMVFMQQNVAVNNHSSGWDGTFNSQPMNSGLYIYQIEIKKGDGTSEVIAGDVFLMN